MSDESSPTQRGDPRGHIDGAVRSGERCSGEGRLALAALDRKDVL